MATTAADIAEALEARRRQRPDMRIPRSTYARLVHQFAEKAKRTPAELDELHKAAKTLNIQPQDVAADIQAVRTYNTLQTRLADYDSQLSKLTKERDAARAALYAKHDELRAAKNAHLRAESALAGLKLDMSKLENIPKGRPHLFVSDM